MGCNSFLTPLIIKFLDTKDAKRWELHEGFRYVCKSGEVIYVPKGFRTDFASVPRFFWRIIPPTGLYGKAAVIHDFLYQEKLFDRARADAIFLEGMELLGVSRWKRNLMYRTVRLFGGRAFGS